MAKTNHFSHGDCVSGKKLNGEHFIGVYEHEYDCGDHAVFDGEMMCMENYIEGESKP